MYLQGHSRCKQGFRRAYYTPSRTPVEGSGPKGNKELYGDSQDRSAPLCGNNDPDQTLYLRPPVTPGEYT